MTKANSQKLINVSLNKLHLDTQNPRHDPLEDEDEIIAQLCRDEQIVNLARDIVGKGTLSPLDMAGVIEMEGNPGHYIVVEGNRRVCALKLLHDPLKAPAPTVRTAFQALSARFLVPTLLSVVLFENRDAARPWIGLRHLGEQDGAGTRRWDAAQKSRYAEAASPNQLALAILDYAEKSGWIDIPQREKLAITTLTRYLGNPLVRAALGLGSHRELLYTHEPLEVEAALRQFLVDASPRADGGLPLIHSRSRKYDREVYARELSVRGVAPQTLLPSSIRPSELAKSDIPGFPTNPGSTHPAPLPHEAPSRLGVSRAPQHPDSRTYLIPKGFAITSNDKSLLRLRGEFYRTPIDNHEFAVNYLLRAFIERVLVLYAKNKGVHQQKMTDQKLVQVCADELAKEGISNNELKPMRVAMSDENAAHSLHTLGSAVHTNFVATRKSLVAAWDNWERVLKLMLARI